MATASTSRSSVRGVIEAVIVVCVLVVGVLSNRPASVPPAGPANPTPLTEEWRISKPEISWWAQSGEVLLVSSDTSLIAVDSRTGEVKWEVPGLQEVVFVSTDGYTLTVTVGDSISRGVWTWSWIDPNGVVLWQAASEWRWGPVVTPGQLVGLKLDQTIAAANGVLVAESQNEGPGSSVAAIATDGSQLWRVDEARAPYDWFESTPFHAASLPIAVLPPTVVVDIGDPADVATVSLATLDIATGTQASVFPVITGSLSDGVPVQVHRAGSWVVWATRQADPDTCDWNGRNVDTAAEWQTTLPCSLGDYTFGGGGKIIGMTELYGSEAERVLFLDVTTGQSHEEEWSSGIGVPLGLGGTGPLSGVSISEATVTAYAIDTGAEVWSRDLDVLGVLTVTELRGIVAATSWSASKEQPGRWITLLSSESGQTIAQYPAPYDSAIGVLALDEHRVFVVSADFVGVYSAPTG